MNKKRQNSFFILIVWFILLLCLFFTGVFHGIQLQQMIDKEKPVEVCTCYLGDNNTIIQDCEVSSNGYKG